MIGSVAAQRISDLDLAGLTNRAFHRSPDAWEDQVLYFLMLDRFSDGQEATRPLFQPSDAGNADRREWEEAGGRWVGGTLAGLTSKLDYLAGLGVTAIWVSPVFKQVSFQPTYHGYGIQNYLDVDPHFGTADDLRELVDQAHARGIYVILDIILNHTGNVFSYEDRNTPWDNGRTYAVRGYNDATGAPSLPFAPVPQAWPDGAVWPAEMQDPATFTQRGYIRNWDWYPEYLDGDFFDLKNVTLGFGANPDDYRPAPALGHLIDIYRWWIAFADIDGFRIDTVKHMELGATRIFASAIHEFAASLGKERFFLVGEITGGRDRAYTTLEQTGLDAALGIDDIPDKLEWMVKGWRNPSDYFDLFRNSLLVRKDSHVWFRDKVVTLYDDHDQVRKGSSKARFCADDDGKRLALPVLALNAMTLGIPCIYYGSEQRFDGAGDSDRYIREAMFGGAFGPFRSRDRHCFDDGGRLYQELANVLALRAERKALRRGRQYLRPISGNGVDFGLPRMLGGRLRTLVPWSRLFVDEELLLAINTDPDAASTAWVTIDDDLHAADDTLRCLYSTDAGQIGQTATVEARNGKAVRLTLPPAGFAVYE
jgi:glycosidase